MKPCLFGKIQSQWDNIVQNLYVMRVCDVLMTKLTLIPDELQRINSQVTQTDQARQLLEILKVKEDKQFENFLAALDATDHKYIADAIRQAEVPDDYMELDYSGAAASTSRSSSSTRIPHGPVNTISSLQPNQKGDTGKCCIESAMAGKDIPTEAKKKHNALCIKLDGLITPESFESMKRMAMTYLGPKLVEKAKSMNALLHQLEVKGVLAVGQYDILIELMEYAGIGIGIDDINETNTDIQSILQSSIHRQERVKKTKEKAVYAKPSADKRKSKGKAPMKRTVVKKKSISKDPTTKKSPMKEAYQSIESLTPSLTRWKIRARVTMKSEIATKRKKNSAGGFNKIKYFQFIVVDEKGEIAGVAFSDAVDKFYNVLEMGKVFYISGATLNEANKKFNSTMHDYQIVINEDACIKPCQDTRDIPRYGRFAFKRIDKLKDLRPGELVDVIAVVKESGESDTVKTKKRKKTAKREIQLVDQSGMQVGLTLWGRDAEQFSSGENLVIAFKGVKVSDWAGRSLTMLPYSQKFDNPKIKEARNLHRWFISEGKQMVFTGFN